MRRHVQLMGGLPLLGAQVAGVVQLGVGYALLESEVAPLLGHKAQDSHHVPSRHLPVQLRLLQDA
jgi:hypothetical protein